MEQYTKEMITWAKHLDVITLRKKVGYLPGYIVLKLTKNVPEDTELRINLGFTKDKQRLFIKLTTGKGFKLSNIGDSKSRYAKTFGIKTLLTQFGEEIIGSYSLLEDVEFEDGVLIFKKDS